MAFHVIIPAAGSGTRMGANIPKQYLFLDGQVLIQHVIRMFDQASRIQSIHVVLSEGDTQWHDDYSGGSNKVTVHHCGGNTRSETVLNGLKAMSASVAEHDWILVHDAARPGLTDQLLNALIDSLEHDNVGGLLALPLADTLKKSDIGSRVEKTISRDQLWQAQTPQMFKFSTLKRALESFNGAPTDEAEAIEALGLKPKLVTGALRNLKVTYPQDLAVLSALFKVN